MTPDQQKSACDFQQRVEPLLPQSAAYAYAIVRSREDAEDAVQEAFVVALARLDDLRSAEAFPGWFRQIVRTQSHRLDRKRRPAITQLSDSPACEPSPAEVVQLAELRERVRSALASLPPLARTSAELFYMQERSISEIAAIVDVPSGTIKRRLHDARALLRDLLADCDDFAIRAGR